MLNRRERERLARREEILQAATRVFADKGFDAASMDEIAQRAEFSKGSVYAYFGSKEDLFISLVENEIDKLLEIVNSCVERPADHIQAVEKLVRDTLVYLGENSAFLRIFSPERASMSKERHPELTERIMPKLQELIGLISECLKEGMREGVIRKVDPTLAAHMLFGMVHACIVNWLVEGQRGSLKKEASAITSIFMDGLRASRTQNPGR